MMNVYLEVQNNRRNALRRLIEFKPWYERIFTGWPFNWRLWF